MYITIATLSLGFKGTAMKANMVSHGIRNRFTIVIVSWVMDHRI